MNRIFITAILVVAVLQNVCAQNIKTLDSLIKGSANIYSIQVVKVENSGIGNLGSIDEIIEAKVIHVFKGDTVNSQISIFQRLICDIDDVDITYRAIPVELGKEYVVFLRLKQYGLVNNVRKPEFQLKDDILGILPRHKLLERHIEFFLER